MNPSNKSYKRNNNNTVYERSNNYKFNDNITNDDNFNIHNKLINEELYLKFFLKLYKFIPV